MLLGKIASLKAEKGFGFIKPSKGGADIFFHMSALRERIEDARIGQECRYEVDASAEKPRANSVQLVGANSGKGPDKRFGNSAKNTRAGGKSFARKDDRGPNRPAGRSQNARRSDLPDFETGFITRILKRDKQGLISSDKHGRELVFDSVEVNGGVPFERLKVGDYVSFLRSKQGYDEKDPTARPVAIKVRYTERKIFHPRLHMSRHPNARAKKPTWR